MIKIYVVALITISFTSMAQEKLHEKNVMSVSGVFEITLEPQSDASAPVGRMTLSKIYSGGLVGKGIGQMISKRTEGGAAVYSAIEEFEGIVGGIKGSFTLFHTGFMSADKQELKIIIVEGSGTDGLKGIQGNLSITQENGVHHYELEYSL